MFRGEGDSEGVAVAAGQGEFDGDVGPLVRRRLDGHPAVQEPDALADALESEPLLLDVVGVEADAPVADADVDPPVALPQRDVDAAAAAVAAGVAERFLDDAEDGVLQGRGKPRASQVVLELDLRPPSRRRSQTRYSMASTIPNSSSTGGRKPLISRRVSSMARASSRAAESKSCQALAESRARVSRKA